MPDGNGSGPTLDLDEVDAFAETAHEGQTRASGAPYITHPRAVRKILEEEFPGPVDDITLAIALLHDVLEDCDVHPTLLLERYGRDVQEGVTLLSWRIRTLGLERNERVYWSGIEKGPRSVRLVKAADRVHNLRECLAEGSERLRRKYIDETPQKLLPILEQAGEAWFVERIEDLLEQTE